MAGLGLIAWAAAADVASAQTVSRVSVDSTGVQANGASTGASVSLDGRYVAFASTASNLVSGDTNNSSDVFVKDRQTGAVTRVSVKSDGTESAGDSIAPSISADGRLIAFVSSAALVADDTNAGCANNTANGPSCADIYVYDRTLAQTTRVSVASDNAQANGPSANPKVSADGRYVAFDSIASNLAPLDTNQNADVFLRDRTAGTTVRLSVSTSNSQGDGPSTRPAMSDDGSLVAFISSATTLDNAPDTMPCDPGTQCFRLFIRTVATGVTTRATLTTPIASQPFASVTVAGLTQTGIAAMSRDGRLIAVQLTTLTPPVTATDPRAKTFDGVVYYVTEQRTRLLTSSRATVVGALQIEVPTENVEGFAFDATGRTLAFCWSQVQLQVVDLLTDMRTSFPAAPPIGSAGTELNGCSQTAVSGTQVLFASADAAIASGDTNAASDIFSLERDGDHDGIPYDWEMTFGLDPGNGSDAALDPDGDGKTNLQEYQAGTNPKGTFTRYLAEGAQNQFFSTFIDVYNPGLTPALVEVRYLGDTGRTAASIFTVDAKRHAQVVPTNEPDASFSTVVESEHLVAVERTMSWGGERGLGTGYGSSAETAITTPSTTWYFAEGATHGAFDLFYLLQNPTDLDANVTITYLLPAGQPPIVLAYALPANSRRTIWVDQEPGLAATDVSAKIESSQPIFAERSLYLSTPGQPFAGGTSGAGIAAPATQWFIAEGATGSFFDLYFLIGNPSAQDANVTVTYLLEDGTHFDKAYLVARQSRLTIGVDGEDPRLAAGSVSAVINSTNSVPIVVERSMWWPSPNWYEGTLTAATTGTSPRWALAGGYISTVDDGNSYLLVANPSDTPATVTFSLNGFSVYQLDCPVRSFPVAAHSRFTLDIQTVCSVNLGPTDGFNRTTISGTIESNGPGIVVERATYWSIPGQFWAAGASTLLTRLP